MDDRRCYVREFQKMQKAVEEASRKMASAFQSWGDDVDKLLKSVNNLELTEVEQARQRSKDDLRRLRGNNRRRRREVWRSF